MEAAVVVKRSAPKHRAMRHHAARDVLRFDIVTRRARTRFRHNAQIAGIDEANKLPTLTR